MQSRGGQISHPHCLAVHVPSRETICRTLPVGDLNDECVRPLTAWRRVLFWGHLCDQDKAGMSWDAAVWSLSKYLGSAPPKHPVDILNPSTGRQPAMWAACEQIAELARIFSRLSSSPLPCDPCFGAFLSEADPTALFTPVGSLLFLGLLNPSASLKNSNIEQRQMLLSQNCTGSGRPGASLEIPL